MVLWGDADAVAPIEIAKSLGEEGHIGQNIIKLATYQRILIEFTNEFFTAGTNISPEGPSKMWAIS